MKPICLAIVPVALLLAASGATLTAQDISPNLATTVPGSFYTDRFTPTVFQLANGVHGRNNVLQLQAGTDATSRPAGQQGTFYNTQGKKTDVNTAGSWLFQPDLYHRVHQLWRPCASSRLEHEYFFLHGFCGTRSVWCVDHVGHGL